MANPIVFLVPVGGLLFWLMSQKKDQPGTATPPVIDASGTVNIPGGGTASGGINIPGIPTSTPGTFPPYTPPYTPSNTSPPIVVAPPYPPITSGPVVPPPPGVTNIQDQIAKAIASNSPTIMLELANILDSQGYTDAATNLRNIARAIQANTNINQAATDAAGKILGGGPVPPLPGTGVPPASGGAAGPGIVPARYALAQAVAMHLGKVSKGREDKILIANFQRQEGLKPDGLYGPATAAALMRYGLRVPAPFYGAATPVVPVSTSTQTSTTVPTVTKLGLAQAVAANIATSSKGRENKNIVASFQKQEGLAADGLYGPATAAAIARYGINAPAPLYGTGSTVVTIPPVTQPPVIQTAGFPSNNKLQLAQMLALSLSKSSKGREDRNLVKKFQQQEGLAADGLYGRGTAAALAKYGIIPPTPFY